MKRATLVFGTARRMAAILLAAFLTLGTIHCRAATQRFFPHWPCVPAP